MLDSKTKLHGMLVSCCALSALVIGACSEDPPPNVGEGGAGGSTSGGSTSGGSTSGGSTSGGTSSGGGSVGGAGGSAGQSTAGSSGTGASGGSAGVGGSAGSGAAGAGATGGTAGSGGTGPVDPIPQTCTEALQRHDAIGCEYWPTVTLNTGLNVAFEFAVVVVNPTATAAVVNIERFGSVVASTTVQAGQARPIRLPWVDELKQSEATRSSTLVRGGAYRLTSSVPTTVYQFNPLELELVTPPIDCPAPCYSYSNDASLLLPTSALGSSYYATSYPTAHLGATTLGTTMWLDAPGFVSVTATANDTQVTIKSTAHVRAGGEVTAMTPGETAAYVLNAGDVLVLASGVMPAEETPEAGKPCSNVVNGSATVTLCPTPPEYDLTGSLITSSKPVSVIGGHDCTFVPYSRFACDHLEESLVPTPLLGTDVLVTAPQAVSGIGTDPGLPDNMFVRVMSASDANMITFDPPVSAPLNLDAGQWVELGPLTTDVRVQASGQLAVSQFMVGENFSGVSAGAGDPAMSITIPIEQYRRDYSVWAPDTFSDNYINITAALGTEVLLDGVTVEPTGFFAIGNSGYGVARVAVTAGSHQLSSAQTFGALAYGYGSFTSYMFPAGLDTRGVDPN